MAYGITVPQPLSINPDRLHASIPELARIGATDGGGVTRLALTDEDRQGRDLLCSWLMVNTSLKGKHDTTVCRAIAGRRWPLRAGPAGGARFTTKRCTSS